MCGAQTGSHPSAASRDSAKAGSLLGQQIPTLIEWNWARICSTFPEEELGVLAGLEPLLGQGSPVCAMPGCPCLCHASHARLSLSFPTGTAPGCARVPGSWAEPLAAGSWRDAQMEPGPERAFLVLCCRSCPKAQHSDPLGLLWPEDWAESTPALQGCHNPVCHP